MKETKQPVFKQDQQLVNADTRITGVAQPDNKTEPKELSIEKREDKLWEQIFYQIICQKCSKVLLEIKSRSNFAFEEIEQSTARHKCETKAKELTKIKGILASNLRTRKTSNTPYMAFFRPVNSQKHSLAECEAQKCKDCEMPVVFRISCSDHSNNCLHKPNLIKGQIVILEGQWANSKATNRPSFTCYSYQVIKPDSE